MGVKIVTEANSTDYVSSMSRGRGKNPEESH